MTTELKPCPCCGKEYHAVYVGDWIYAKHDKPSECILAIMEDDESGLFAADNPTEWMKLQNKWNTRAPVQPHMIASPAVGNLQSYDAAPVQPEIPKDWQPIETAPKDGTNILLTNGITVAQGWWEHEDPFVRESRDLHGAYADQMESDGFDDWLDCEGGMRPNPTHWMPMPPAPEVKPFVEFRRVEL